MPCFKWCKKKVKSIIKPDENDVASIISHYINNYEKYRIPNISITLIVLAKKGTH